MARTVEEIEQFIYDQMATKPSLANLVVNPSQQAIWKDFVYAIASEIAIFEQLQDQYLEDVEARILAAPVSTIDWVIQKCLEFQYDSVTPQYIQLIDGVVTYDPVDETKRLASLAVARVNSSRLVDIFVAKNDPPEKFTPTEVSALQAYFTDGGSSTTLGIGLGVAGIAYNVYSLDPDEVCIKGDVYVDGQYATTAQADIIVAIETYLSSLGKNGVFNYFQLLKAITSVIGVIDVDLEDVAIRSNATVFASRSFLLQTKTLLLKEIDAPAGYAIGETTAANTLSDLINIIVA